MKDLIERQAAIDAITEIDEGVNMDIYTCEVKEILAELPSAQPEVIEEVVKDYCRKRCMTILTNDYYHKLMSEQKGLPDLEE